jgi:hypothetical protein
MDLKCKNGECNNVYRVDVSAKGYGVVGQVIVAWKCVVCGKWNVFAKGELIGGDGVSVNFEW